LQLAALEAEKAAAVAAEEYLKAAALKDKIQALKMSAAAAAASSGDDAPSSVDVSAAGGAALGGTRRPTAEDLAAVLPPISLKPLNLRTPE
jgi:hypothetical protein